MILRLDDLAYIATIDRMIARGDKIAKKSDHPYPNEGMMFCPECDVEIDQYDDMHLVIDFDGNPIIAIACEGYHTLDTH